MSLKSLVNDYITGNGGKNWEITKALLKDRVKLGSEEFSSYIKQNPEKALLALLGGAIGYNAVTPSVAAAQEFSKPQQKIVQEQTQSDFDALYNAGWSDEPVNAHIDSLARAFLTKNGIKFSGDDPIYLRTFGMDVNGKFSKNLLIYYGNVMVGAADDKDSLFVTIYKEPILDKDGNFNIRNPLVNQKKVERKH